MRRGFVFLLELLHLLLQLLRRPRLLSRGVGNSQQHRRDATRKPSNRLAPSGARLHAWSRHHKELPATALSARVDTERLYSSTSVATPAVTGNRIRRHASNSGIFGT